jgi:hypothetical protein
MRSEELKSSQFLLDFLYETDSKAFAKCMKEADKIKGPRNLEDYILSTG